MIDRIIETNKWNELFRDAWKDLIDESSTEFEKERLFNLRERVKKSRETQEWKSIVVNTQAQIPNREATQGKSGIDS